MSVTVHFTGICTHISRLGTDAAPTSHQVVLVRADNGAFINGKKIPPHIAKLVIDPADIIGIDGYPHGLEPTGEAGAWRLRGVQLAVEGVQKTQQPPFQFDDSYQLIPRLTSL